MRAFVLSVGKLRDNKKNHLLAEFRSDLYRVVPKRINMLMSKFVKEMRCRDEE